MSFLQSREWEEIQRRDGHEAHRLRFGDESFVYFKHVLPFGFFYLYAPRPALKHAAACLSAVEGLKDSGAIFFRIEPEHEFKIKSKKFKVVPSVSLQPRETVILDLTKSDEELLAAMHPKTRYNIHVAKRHGVVVEQEVGSDAISRFYELLSQTARRDKFHLHPKSHYEHLLQSNSHDFSNELFFATYQKEIAAAALVNFYQGIATYLHGASRYELRSLMAPYLLHWQIAKEARRRGFRQYDLWGIEREKWPGVTRFKLGFGGNSLEYPSAFDVVFRPVWYFIYRALRSIL